MFFLIPLIYSYIIYSSHFKKKFDYLIADIVLKFDSNQTHIVIDVEPSLTKRGNLKFGSK